jgi:hypothetical protein
MTLFNEKVLISIRFISALMSNLIKKSWTDSKVGRPFDKRDRTPAGTLAPRQSLQKGKKRGELDQKGLFLTLELTEKSKLPFFFVSQKR